MWERRRLDVRGLWELCRKETLSGPVFEIWEWSYAKQHPSDFSDSPDAPGRESLGAYLLVVGPSLEDAWLKLFGGTSAEATVG